MTHQRLTRTERWIAAVNVTALAGFGLLALGRGNYEFVLYIPVVAIIVAALLRIQPRVKFSTGVLWGLTAWGLLHLAGGNLRVGDGVLYSVQLVPVLLRYDQLVHGFGFGVATLVCHRLLAPSLRPDDRRLSVIAFLTVLMGCGLGALNEILEFVAVKAVPQTNVGGYDNTLWDLIFNLFGALSAAGWLTVQRRQARPGTTGPPALRNAG